MNVAFNCGVLYTDVKCADASWKELAKLNAAIQEVTQARPSGYQYMPSYRNRNWDGYIRLYRQGKFPTGLLRVVVDAIRTEGFCDICINNPDLPDVLGDIADIQPNIFGDIVLRPYQLQAVGLMHAYSRGVLKMATNSGKTEVVAAYAKVMYGNLLILVTKKDLLYQTAERLVYRLGESVGLIGDGNWKVERVTVGMIQTLSRHSDRMQHDLGGLHAVVFDECHHLPSKTSQAIMFGLGAPFRFGMSGTPLRYDNLADLVLVGATGPMLLEITNADLIASDISAIPMVDMYVVAADDEFDVKWQVAYSEHIVHNDIRNGLIKTAVEQQTAASTLVLVERLKHGRILSSMLDGSVFVSGSSSIDARRDALDNLRTGDGSVVVATNIFDEGVDVPAVDLLVLAGGGKGHIKLLQRLGRGMRRKIGSNILRVVDFIDDVNVHLLKHSARRAEIYEAEGFEVTVIGG